MDELPKLLTAADVCTALRITKPTLQRMVESGLLPCIRLGTGPKAQRRFRLSDVESLLDFDRTEPAA